MALSAAFSSHHLSLLLNTIAMSGLRTSLSVASLSIILLYLAQRWTSDDDETIDDSHHQNDTTTTTRITNPGIAERLEKDISCFEAYGFSFQRDTNNNGIFSSDAHRQVIPIALRIQLQVKDVTLVTSVGPFLRTLVRLCVDPIDPRALQAVIVIGSSQKKDDPRALAHSIHMLIRNSMGAALFLNIFVVLPAGIRRESVLGLMKCNENGCYEYPSVSILESSEIKSGVDNRQPFDIGLGLLQESKDVPPTVEKPLTQSCLSGFDPATHFISLSVLTRMCTIRLTPLIYHLSQKILVGTASNPLTSKVESSESPLIMVCLEKISNLYRVLMLCRDYGGVDLIGRQLVVVCKDAKAVKRFDSEAQKFVSKNFLKEQPSNASFFPKVLSIADARDLLRHDVLSSVFPNVVAFDLHEDAKTLGEDNDEAKVMLSSAGALILGYESDGIPEEINQAVSQYVQIKSRTSVNIVAAFSIALHVTSS